MARITPFKAIRPPRHLAHLVVTRPYYTYSSNVMEAKLESNKFSFMHIINPEHGLSDRHAPNSQERFEKVHDKFMEFLDEQYLVEDSRAHLYVYRQTLGDRSYTGVICGTDVSDYDTDRIKKHEATITNREEVFLKYLEITGFNAEPVLLSHAPNKKLKPLLQFITSKRSEFEFSTTDAVKHELWLVDKETEQPIIHAFEGIENLYIADGHHRSASSSKLAELMRSRGVGENHPSQFFLAFLIDEDELDIFPFHRVVKDLNGLSFQAFLAKLSDFFDVAETDKQTPESDDEIILVRNNSHFLLKIKKDKVDFSHPIKSLSTQYLTDLILEPILDIFDQKTSDRIDFVSGHKGIGSTLSQLSKHPNGVAFVLHPISMAQVKTVADEHLIMPPKSTWVEPKLRSGMTIYSFHHDSI